MEADDSSKMLVTMYQTTWCHIPGNIFIVTAVRTSDLTCRHYITIHKLNAEKYQKETPMAQIPLPPYFAY
jgi:hypothetical protein